MEKFTTLQFLLSVRAFNFPPCACSSEAKFLQVTFNFRQSRKNRISDFATQNNNSTADNGGRREKIFY